MSNRNRLISSLIAMFNEVHGNDIAPDWLVAMYERASDDELRRKMGNWQQNYPAEWRRHGIYCM